MSYSAPTGRGERRDRPGRDPHPADHRNRPFAPPYSTHPYVEAESAAMSTYRDFSAPIGSARATVCAPSAPGSAART